MPWLSGGFYRRYRPGSFRVIAEGGDRRAAFVVGQ
jgi:hypothetical protein